LSNDGAFRVYGSSQQQHRAHNQCHDQVRDHQPVKQVDHFFRDRDAVKSRNRLCQFISQKHYGEDEQQQRRNV